MDQIYWQALARPFKWHIGKVCIISRKKVTETGKNVKKGLRFVLFHFFDNENGENIFFGPSQLKVPKRWVLMVLKVFQCLLKQKSYKPNKIFLDLLSTNWAFEPLCIFSWRRYMRGLFWYLHWICSYNILNIPFDQIQGSSFIKFVLITILSVF